VTGAARWSEQHLGYCFRDTDLLERALTHKSRGARNNERLEFLGDSVLGCVIAAELCQQEVAADEGTLSRMRALLVRRETLAELACELGLGDQLNLGGGELRSGGHRRESILADAVEALIGAVFHEAGFSTAQQLVRRLYASRLASLPAPDSLKDPKTRLQERLQAGSLAVPRYRVTAESGPEHDRRFVVECEVPESGVRTVGRGGSRRRAEQAAAEAALQALGAEDRDAP